MQFSLTTERSTYQIRIFADRQFSPFELVADG